MASRKDNKGRVLQTGEYQREDGRYSFSYSDAVGTRHVFLQQRSKNYESKKRIRMIFQKYEFTYFKDWKILAVNETIFEDYSGGVRH